MSADRSRNRTPNHALERLIEESIEAGRGGRKSLAARVNELGRREGVNMSYTHTSLVNWTARAMRPRDPAPRLLAQALAERLGRPVTTDDIGMGAPKPKSRQIGLDFPRDPADALSVATEYWSTVHRRDFMTKGPFAIAAYTTPVLRYLAAPTDTATPRRGSRRQVGAADLAELWDAADEARRWDSKYGGGTWQISAVTECLRVRAAPLLAGTFTEVVGRELFNVTAELSRVSAWAAFDAGHHASSQQDFIQALRLAKASGDLQTGCYVLATMSLQTMLRGYPDEAVDMAEGAYDRARHTAGPRVLSFAKLAAARAYAKLGDSRAAWAALSESVRLLESVHPGSRDPQWLSYLTFERISADAVEIARDLGEPAAALRWDLRAEAMPQQVYTRAVGIRMAVLGTTHLQAGDLDQGLAYGDRAVEILARVHSDRAHGYLRHLTGAFDPWRAEPQVAEFLHRADLVLSPAA
ncbi:sporulation protein [Streptomyces sp. NPDC056682]|uniref:sporulation protein n=1 Tax=Streptomyces sp. NPDC056682 TaxID=3345909 RepID=UPI0036A6FE90